MSVNIKHKLRVEPRVKFMHKTFSRRRQKLMNRFILAMLGRRMKKSRDVYIFDESSATKTLGKMISRRRSSFACL